MDFLPYDLNAAEQCRPYLATQTDRFCDWTPGGTYMWRTYFNSRYAITDECLILLSTYIDGQDYYSVPLGTGDREAALTTLEAHCATTGCRLQFSTVSPTDTQWLIQRYGKDTKISPMPIFYDYLYRYEDLATLAGRRYSAQRNHINGFIKKWTGWQYQELTPTLVPAVEDFLHALVERKQQTDRLSPMELADVAGTMEVLRHLDALGMTGGVITVDGDMVGFSVGEVQRDTLYVHIEKGDIRFPGIYQLLVREYAAHTAAPGLAYINREDDAGDEGLRRSKLAYRPCAILEKNLVIPQKG